MDRPGKKSIDGRPLTRPAVRGLLSKGGPEPMGPRSAGPGSAGPGSAGPEARDPGARSQGGTGTSGIGTGTTGTSPAWPPFVNEPTQQFPVIAARSVPAFAEPLVVTPKQQRQAGSSKGEAATAQPPGTQPAKTEPANAEPARTAAPAKVQARAVIIYERRSLGLLVLTAVLVALTAGVVLGQTVADVPHTISAAAQTQPTDAGFSAPPSVAPSPSTPAAPVGSGAPGQVPGQGSPGAGQRVSAPLGRAKAQLLEVGGGAALVTVRSVDLGDRLFDVAALDDSATPRVVTGPAGPRLEFVRTGAAGRIGAVIQLNSKVKWKLRLAGGAAEQDIDMRAGGLAGIELVGGASRTVVRLPKPKGTVPLSVTGVIGELDVHVWPAVPVRVKLTKGAAHAVLDGKVRRTAASGTTLTSTGWTTATDRYELTAPGKLDAIQVDHA